MITPLRHFIHLHLLLSIANSSEHFRIRRAWWELDESKLITCICIRIKAFEYKQISRTPVLEMGKRIWVVGENWPITNLRLGFITGNLRVLQVLLYSSSIANHKTNKVRNDESLSRLCMIWFKFLCRPLSGNFSWALNTDKLAEAKSR